MCTSLGLGVVLARPVQAIKEVITNTLATCMVSEAFEKTRDKFDFAEGKLVLVTEDNIDGALQLIKTFIRDETMNKSLQATWCDDYERLCLSSPRDHFSIMVVHRETGEPMALRQTRIITTERKFDPSVVEDEKCKKMIKLFQYVEGEIKLFERLGCTEAFHFFMLSVAKKYRQRGLGSKIFEAAMDMIQTLGLGSIVIKGEGTSNYSKRIYEKCGFDILHEVQFSEYYVEGEQVFCNTGEHKSMKTYAIKL